jgi:outer membrane autotransporter protein
MRRSLLATTVCLALGIAAEPARAQRVDVEMAIVFDGSFSVTTASFDRIIGAHVSLFRDARLADFLQRQNINALAVAAFSFGSTGATPTPNRFMDTAVVRQITPWQVIRNTTDATGFANSLEQAIGTGRPGYVGRLSPIGPAMWTAIAGTRRTGGSDPPRYNFDSLQFTGLGTITPASLLQNGLIGDRAILNVVTDGRQNPPHGQFYFANRNPLNPSEPGDAAPDLEIRLPGININALAIKTSDTTAHDYTFEGITAGRLANGGNAFWMNLDLRGSNAQLFESTCQKFGLELVAGTPRATDCATLLDFTVLTVMVPRTVTSSTHQVVHTRVAQVTDVALPVVRTTSLTAAETGRQTAAPSLISSVNDTAANTRTDTYDQLTTILMLETERIEDVVPLRMPLEYGAVTRLGAALFGDILANQPQRAQRLRGQGAARGPTAVRGDGAPSAAARPEGGVFALAGLNGSLRSTATDQFAALPGFDFGWGEAPAGLDQELTGQTGLWGRPFYSRTRVSAGRGVDRYDQTHRGFALGADVRIGRYGLIGVWGGGSSADVAFAAPGGGAPSSASMTSWVGGIYGSAATGNPDTGLWYADVTLGYGAQDWTLTRTTLAGAAARGEFRSPALGAYTEAGFAGQWRGLQWQPHLFLRTVQTERPGLAETGADEGVARNLDGARFTSVQAGPGLRVSQAISLGDGISLVPEGRIRWEREFSDNAAAVSGAFVFDGSRVPFSGRAPGLDRDALGLGASLKLARLTGGPAGGGFGLDLDWDASFSNDTTAHRLALQLRLAW